MLSFLHFGRVEKEKTQIACECDELATRVEDANRGKVLLCLFTHFFFNYSLSIFICSFLDN